MILYNVTVSVDPAIHEDWLAWMKATHVPDVMATGCFVEHRMYRVMDGAESGEITYSVQYLCRTFDDYTRYRDDFAPALQRAHTGRYADRFVAFRTLLETV